MILFLALFAQLASADPECGADQVAQAVLRRGYDSAAVATDHALKLTAEDALRRMELLLNRPLDPTTRIQLERTRAAIDSRNAALKARRNYAKRVAEILELQGKLATEKDNRSQALSLVRNFAEKKLPFSVAKMHEIHETLLAGRINSDERLPPGRVRFSHVFLGGEHSFDGGGRPKQSMTFLDPRAVPQALKNAEEWYVKNDGHIHPIQLAAGLYRRLLSIHPYEDGNGRTCRLVADWVLISHGYPPTSFAHSDPVIPVLPYAPKNTPNDVVENLFTQSVVRSIWTMEKLEQPALGH